MRSKISKSYRVLCSFLSMQWCLIMTPEQFAQFEIFNQLNFWGGLFLGLIITGFFKSLLSIFNSNVQRPKRIKFIYLNDSEKQDKPQYLYLYKDCYYTLEQRDFLHKERLKNIKEITPFDYRHIFILLLTATFSIFLFILCLKNIVI